MRNLGVRRARTLDRCLVTQSDSQRDLADPLSTRLVHSPSLPGKRCLIPRTRVVSQSISFVHLAFCQLDLATRCGDKNLPQDDWLLRLSESIVGNNINFQDNASASYEQPS